MIQFLWTTERKKTSPLTQNSFKYNLETFFTHVQPECTLSNWKHNVAVFNLVALLHTPQQTHKKDIFQRSCMVFSANVFPLLAVSHLSLAFFSLRSLMVCSTYVHLNIYKLIPLRSHFFPSSSSPWQWVFCCFLHFIAISFPLAWLLFSAQSHDRVFPYHFSYSTKLVMEFLHLWLLHNKHIFILYTHSDAYSTHIN